MISYVWDIVSNHLTLNGSFLSHTEIHPLTKQFWKTSNQGKKNICKIKIAQNIAPEFCNVTNSEQYINNINSNKMWAQWEHFRVISHMKNLDIVVIYKTVAYSHTHYLFYIQDQIQYYMWYILPRLWYPRLNKTSRPSKAHPVRQI